MHESVYERPQETETKKISRLSFFFKKKKFKFNN